MSATTIALFLGGYFALLFIISIITGRKSSNKAFYLGNRQSPWFVVAFGMIGASLSGVTFISVPGWVMSTGFTYMQMVMGYVFGYIAVAHVLLPVYYKLNLTSIYEYLLNRFGRTSYKTGAAFFLLSRTIGASFRLFLVANVLYLVVLKAFGFPFWGAVLIAIALIYIYTFRSGIKTIVWTDSFQTLVMLLAVGFAIYELTKGNADAINQVWSSELSKTFVFNDWTSSRHFLKMFLSGIFITIVMTGLDQDMMQKNLSCKNLKDAKKNMQVYGFAFVPVNILFLMLGALLILKANAEGIQLPQRSDDLFPMLATNGTLSKTVGILFILGLAAAAYSSADSAVTSLTTSFSIDILETNKLPEAKSKKIRMWIHLGFSALIFGIILAFKAFNNSAVVNSIFMAAGYTYGPLLGIYAFGFFTKHKLNEKWVPVVMILAPIFSYLISIAAKNIGYKMGYELLILNGAITYLGLLLIKKADR